MEAQPTISPKAPFWFVSSDLVAGVYKDYHTENTFSGLDSYLNRHCLTPDDGLYQATWYALLTRGTASDLRREKDKRILACWNETIRTDLRILMGQHYLNTLDGLVEWSEKILNYIHDVWKQPGFRNNQETESHFWKGVDDGAKKEFRKWLIQAEIESFFEGVRADFWRIYVRQGYVQDVKKILAGDGFMLDFDSFGVVEFKNVGNAAYIYPKQVFDQLWETAHFWANEHSHFKDTRKTARLKEIPTWDGRILHFRGWQQKTQEKIQKLLR